MSNLTAIHNYLTMMMDSYIDSKIFLEMYDYYNKNKAKDIISEPNLSSLFYSSINGFYSFILYSAFSYEAYVNLLGNNELPLNFHEKYFDRLPVLDKLSAIVEMKYGVRIDKGKPPFQVIRDLFKARDNIVHDKGKSTNLIDDVKKEMEKRRIDIDQKKVLSSFLEFNKFMQSIKSETQFLSQLNINSIRAWESNKKYLKIAPGLEYAHTSFPSKIEYEFTVRRHTGFSPHNIYEDLKQHIIYSKE